MQSIYCSTRVRVQRKSSQQHIWLFYHFYNLCSCIEEFWKCDLPNNQRADTTLLMCDSLVSVSVRLGTVTTAFCQRIAISYSQCIAEMFYLAQDKSRCRTDGSPSYISVYGKGLESKRRKTCLGFATESGILLKYQNSDAMPNLGRLQMAFHIGADVFSLRWL